VKEYTKPTIIEETVYVSDTAIASTSSAKCYVCIDSHSNYTGNDDYIPDATKITWNCWGTDKTPYCEEDN